MSSAPLEADVFAGSDRAGFLQRRENGCVFSYSPAYLQGPAQSRGALSQSLPLSAQPLEYFGSNVHPFFAGLLPEGWRLNTLLARTKASPDDLFSLLLEVGADAVGDVAVCSSGDAPRDLAPEVHLEGGELDFGEVLRSAADRLGSTNHAVGIAGVQQKLSASMVSLPVTVSRKNSSAWILKLTPPNFEALAENEAFFMACARACGLPVADTLLVRDLAGQAGLLVRRFDRRIGARGRVQRIPQEDMCQIHGRFPADKYHFTYRQVLEGLAHCEAPRVQRLHALRLAAYSYLIANGDLHAKNISTYRPSETAGWRLTPAYDLLSTLPYGDQHMALSIENRDAKLRRKHFIDLAQRFEVPPRATERMLNALVARLPAHLARLEDIGLSQRKATFLRRTIEERMRALA